MNTKAVGADALEFFFGCIGYFNHYQYFTKELWRKVKGFENTDEAEVKCAFLSKWTHNVLGITTYPVGAAWSTPNGNEDYYNEYMEEWKPIFDDFNEWCVQQR